MDLDYSFPKPTPKHLTERDVIMKRVRSHKKWARRRFWLRLRATIFGRRQVRMPENRVCQSARSSSPILRNVTSGTVKA